MVLRCDMRLNHAIWLGHLNQNEESDQKIMDLKHRILAKNSVVKTQCKLMAFLSFTGRQSSAQESTFCCDNPFETLIFHVSNRLPETKSGIVSWELEVSGSESWTLASRIPRFCQRFFLALPPFGPTDSGRDRCEPSQQNATQSDILLQILEKGRNEQASTPSVTKSPLSTHSLRREKCSNLLTCKIE
jgi:hypothetical protein